MREGRVAVSFVTLISRSTGQTVEHLDYGSLAQAFGMAQGQLAYYRGLELDGHVRILEDGPGLRRHIDEWENWEASGAKPGESPPMGFVISMEGADPIHDPAQLEAWWDAGLRLLGLTHYGPGRYAGGTGTALGTDRVGQTLAARNEPARHAA